MIKQTQNQQMRLSGAEVAVAHLLMDYGNDLGSLTPSALKVNRQNEKELGLQVCMKVKLTDDIVTVGVCMCYGSIDDDVL